MGTLFIIPDPDILAGLGEGVPGDVKPGGGGEELVDEVVGLEEVNHTLKLSRIFGADIGGLTDEVLRVADTAHLAIHRL